MRTEAIILKKIPIREYDELVVCYTKHAGKQTYQAKSVRRHTSKQASHLDILNLVDFTLVHPKGSLKEQLINGHSIITQAYSLRTFSRLKSSLPAMAVAFFILESFDKLVFEGEIDDKLWNFLTDNLNKLDELSQKRIARWPTVIESTRKELMETMGYEPNTLIEDLAGVRFRSLQFANIVLR